MCRYLQLDAFNGDVCVCVCVCACACAWVGGCVRVCVCVAEAMLRCLQLDAFFGEHLVGLV